MSINPRDFFRACNPAQTLNYQNERDRQLYIDFSAVRGTEVVGQLERVISWSEGSTCQLFTGHIGCGKSTELLCLKSNLENQGFHVVYFESSRMLELGDVAVSDILLAIAQQVSQSLQAAQISLIGGYFQNLFQECQAFLKTPIDLKAQAEFSLWGMGTLSLEAQQNPTLRSQLRQFLEPQVQALIRGINEEIIQPTIAALHKQGQAGLVILVDNLDRIDGRQLASGQTLPEYIFISRGERLRQLACHVVYTIPLALRFANERPTMEQRLGEITVLPMVPVRCKDGSVHEAGLAKLREMILVRGLAAGETSDAVTLMAQLFDHPDTLDHICFMSGGHVRNLLRLMQSCLRKSNRLPIQRANVERAVQEARAELMLSITPEEWVVLRKVQQTQAVNGDAEQDLLLRNLWAFEYRHQGAQWFAVNPLLTGAEPLGEEG
ncbi:MAG: AAA family ATPase [Spirulina sp. SIO3F2]|nr:AAA family ATPase [Spirulina sp. SIO3F2]